MSEDGETSHAQFQMPPLEELKACVLDLSRPIAQRMRSIFYLRTVGGDEAVATLCKGVFMMQQLLDDQCQLKLQCCSTAPLELLARVVLTRTFAILCSSAQQGGHHTIQA